MTNVPVSMVVNGRERSATVEPRKTLADVLREDFHLTGTHLGCEHGVCGACTVMVDGSAVRSCLLFGVQADGAEITTIEGIAPAPGELGDVQSAFRDCHGLQCGFCTPGFVVSIEAFLAENPTPDDDEIRSALTGNLCRCTGYQGIIKAVRQVVRSRAGDDAGRATPAADPGAPTGTVPTVDGVPAADGVPTVEGETTTTVPSAP